MLLPHIFVLSLYRPPLHYILSPPLATIFFAAGAVVGGGQIQRGLPYFPCGGIDISGTHARAGKKMDAPSWKLRETSEVVSKRLEDYLLSWLVAKSDFEAEEFDALGRALQRAFMLSETQQAYMRAFEMIARTAAISALETHPRARQRQRPTPAVMRARFVEFCDRYGEAFGAPEIARAASLMPSFDDEREMRQYFARTATAAMGKPMRDAANYYLAFGTLPPNTGVGDRAPPAAAAAAAATATAVDEPRGRVADWPPDGRMPPKKRRATAAAAGAARPASDETDGAVAGWLSSIERARAAAAPACPMQDARDPTASLVLARVRDCCDLCSAAQACSAMRDTAFGDAAWDEHGGACPRTVCLGELSKLVAFCHSAAAAQVRRLTIGTCVPGTVAQICDAIAAATSCEHLEIRRLTSACGRVRDALPQALARALAPAIRDSHARLLPPPDERPGAAVRREPSPPRPRIRDVEFVACDSDAIDDVVRAICGTGTSYFDRIALHGIDVPALMPPRTPMVAAVAGSPAQRIARFRTSDDGERPLVVGRVELDKFSGGYEWTAASELISSWNVAADSVHLRAEAQGDAVAATDVVLPAFVEFSKLALSFPGASKDSASRAIDRIARLRTRSLDALFLCFCPACAEPAPPASPSTAGRHAAAAAAGLPARSTAWAVDADAALALAPAVAHATFVRVCPITVDGIVQLARSSTRAATFDCRGAVAPLDDLRHKAGGSAESGIGGCNDRRAPAGRPVCPASPLAPPYDETTDELFARVFRKMCYGPDSEAEGEEESTMSCADDLDRSDYFYAIRAACYDAASPSAAADAARRRLCQSAPVADAEMRCRSPRPVAADKDDRATCPPPPPPAAPLYVRAYLGDEDRSEDLAKICGALSPAATLVIVWRSARDSERRIALSSPGAAVPGAQRVVRSTFQRSGACSLPLAIEIHIDAV